MLGKSISEIRAAEWEHSRGADAEARFPRHDCELDTAQCIKNAQAEAKWHRDNMLGQPREHFNAKSKENCHICKTEPKLVPKSGCKRRLWTDPAVLKCDEDDPTPEVLGYGEDEAWGRKETPKQLMYKIPLWSANAFPLIVLQARRVMQQMREAGDDVAAAKDAFANFRRWLQSDANRDAVARDWDDAFGVAKEDTAGRVCEGYNPFAPREDGDERMVPLQEPRPEDIARGDATAARSHAEGY